MRPAKKVLTLHSCATRPRSKQCRARFKKLMSDEKSKIHGGGQVTPLQTHCNYTDTDHAALLPGAGRPTLEGGHARKFSEQLMPKT